MLGTVRERPAWDIADLLNLYGRITFPANARGALTFSRGRTPVQDRVGEGGVCGDRKGRGGGHLLRRQLRREVASSSDREAALSPSMTARLTQMTHPLAPSRQSVMAPGAQPRARATGPSAAYPAWPGHRYNQSEAPRRDVVTHI